MRPVAYPRIAIYKQLVFQVVVNEKNVIFTAAWITNGLAD
jgi:hypothetical protein